MGFGSDLVIRNSCKQPINMSFGIDGRMRGCGSDKLCRWLAAGMKLE